MPASDPIFALASVDLVKLWQPCHHIAPHLPSLRHRQAPFTFILNIMVRFLLLLGVCVDMGMRDVRSCV